jgi:hypothetical protein
MFVFLTCIRHPDSATNYALIEHMFELCARSVCNQSDPNFHFVVTCNKKPPLSFDDERITYLELDYPLPADRRGVLLDKGCKRLAGLYLAQSRFDVSYYMMLDADDWVSRDIVSQTNEFQGQTPGWWVECGYLVDYAARTTQRKAGLNDFCGSTLILRADILHELAGLKPNQLSHESTFSELESSADEHFLTEVLGNHRDVKAVFAQRDQALEKFPGFPVAWVINSGENESRTAGKNSGLNYTQGFCDKFGLTDTPIETNQLSFVAAAREQILYTLSQIRRALQL